MFSKNFSFRRKHGDEARPQKPRSGSPHSSTAGVSPPDSDDDAGSLHSMLQAATSATSSDRKNSETDPGPLGLNVIYTPENGHKADIIFIHGLGGSSRMTWSKDKNPELFWPLTFLPLEPEICLARILSFGYQAKFRKTGNVSTAVLDFAKELLYDLKYATDEQGVDSKMGSVPLLFVVHSMGGLIVKEAYMQGQNDPEYEKIVKAISAITFLSTPHRGTNLADLLNRILSSTGVNNSKKYISELAKNSFTLQKLNEQFRHIAPRLDIVSFYETQPTSIGLKNARVMVLEKDSSVLGYPGETSKALNADHHGVCKFENTRDPNYITVRNILKSLMGKIISTTSAKESNGPLVSNRTRPLDLKALLAISELPDVDYIFFRDQWTRGTNEWILKEPSYVEWLSARGATPHLLWVNGGAAAGKSVLSSFVINSLVEQGLCCQYFFIRFSDRKKRGLSLLLRSMAYQIAQQVPGFLEKLTELVDEAVDFETADPKTIWERIFKSLLFKMKDDQPLYWVIDGFDEADDVRGNIKLLSDIAISSMPIRIFLVSRETSEIAASLHKIPKEIHQREITFGRQLEDLRCYISQELSIHGSSEFRESVVQRIIEGSRNNFLWVRLAVEKINSCHTHADVERSLRELPPGMEAIYDRMAISIAENPSQPDRALASTILQRVTCSFRVLTVAELSQTLDADVSEMLDFQQSITNLCGGFVVIDNGGHVAMIHQTAREYLLDNDDRPFRVDRDAAHEQLFLSCMRSLKSQGLRAKINRNARPEFLDYSAKWWPSHLTSISPNSDQVFNHLHKFLTSHWILTWIQVLATDSQLRILVQASQRLSRYTARRRKFVDLRNEDHQIVEQQFIESWAVDLVKLVGKFGSNLRRNPESIYKLIPPFCPPNSAIYQQFGKSEAKTKTLMISGFSTQNWDDSLARMSFGFGTYASSISAAGAQIAVLTSSGSVSVFDSSIFEEAAASPLKHGERVYRMALNSTGTLLVTYGFKTTKVWNISTGSCTLTVPNLESRPRPLAMLLINNNSTLLVGSDDRKIRSLNLDETLPSWQLVAELEEPELEGHFLNSSSYMALNNDGSLIVVAYRGHPLSAWEVDGPVHVNHCWRARDEVARGEVIEAVWHPHSPEIVGLYIEGVVFKWNPYEGEPEEIAAGASRLAMSSDGNLFATGDVHGTVKIYTTSEFTLIYQLASQNTVLGLAFSPDSRRFYDIRGYYGSAWEPNALMRYAEQRGKGAETESGTESIVPSFMASTSSSQRIDSITTLAASPIGKLYCCGTEYGTVRLFDTQKGYLLDLHVSKSFLGIEQLIWSHDGRYIGFSDSSKKVYIVSITSGATESDPIVESKAQLSVKSNAKGPILQLMFQPDSSHLLVYTSSTICRISLESASVTGSLDWPSDGSKWITHPHDSALILGFGAGSVDILDWNFTERHTYKIKIPPRHDQLDGISSSRSVDRVLVTSDKEHILVQVSVCKTSREKDFLYFATPSCSKFTAGASDLEHTAGPIVITPTTLPWQVTSQISLALSFLTNDRLIFLSKDFSICSWRIPSEADLSLSSPSPPKARLDDTTNAASDEIGLKRYHIQDFASSPGKSTKEIFALPGDWISREYLALCSVWNKERTFLCPRNGEVAVVRSAGLV